VTQLGALVLAVLLRRPLGGDEYPKAAGDLVVAATSDLNLDAGCLAALRMWLQRALQLNPKELFASAADASHAFNTLLSPLPGRRFATQLLNTAVRQLIPS
jgi:hypothetical protein